MIKVHLHLLRGTLCFATFAMSLPRTSDVGVSVGEVIDATILKHTDWACSWLFANWEARALEGHGVREDLQGRQKPAVLSTRARKKAQTTHEIQFNCLDNRTAGRVQVAVEHENEVTVMGPYYLACNPDTEYVLLLNGHRYDCDSQPWCSNNSRKYGICAPRQPSRNPALPYYGSALIEPGQTSCVTAEMAASLASLSAYMESSAGEGSESADEIPMADASVAFISLMELGTSNAVMYQNRAVVTLKVDHYRASVYRACAKQLAGSLPARLRLISIK